MFSMVPFGIPYDNFNWQHESKCTLLNPGTLMCPSLLLVLNFSLECQINHTLTSREMSFQANQQLQWFPTQHLFFCHELNCSQIDWIMSQPVSYRKFPHRINASLAPILEWPQLVSMQQSSHVFFLNFTLSMKVKALVLALQIVSNAPKNHTKAWKSH